ncbi:MULTISPECIES: hypothetical protein [Pseudomonas]|uniref:hypothetical protein n=1 Tax=Pseudomonas TaxID=286 RepID=UPI0008A5A3F8|nr:MULTISPECIES: hypothetical protein [Pseudomonas]MBG5512296.1 hypothetical protein [Pseudomonas aeruginosa]MBG7407084.1 hypothetical protein [Pseudomonas aeruginosa]MBH9333585.1 hypothetical protein [Pseudomonas aeruginosa]MBI8893416.1 hypothetical protein [Pseudomonas aeruginosa]MBV6139504.1 hypothetical protein [Pseudomonas aeruginosa]
MLLRTISVETAEQTELNAALLCGFAIPASDRNFIAYSLNEQVDETDSRVYIASLFKTDDGFRLGRLDTDEACEAAIQVFRQLVREATTGNRRTSDLAYHLIDLQDAAIAPSRREEHRSLVLEREWVMKLVTFESPHGYGPALDGEEPCADVPPLVHEALFEDAAPDVFAADDADEATDGPAEPIDEPEAAEDETVTEAGCAEPEPRPEAETAAPEGRAPAEFATKAEQSAKVADAEAIGAFVDNASHLREELADLAQLLHPALHAAEESSMPPSPSPLAAPAPEPVSARVPSLSLRLRVPPARLAGAEGEADAREAPTQAAAVIRQPEDEAHVDTDTALDIGNDTEHLLQDVQGTLADLAGMAQQLSQQKQEALKQQESLESLQTQLHEKERQLQEKEKQLRQWHKRLQDDRQALERETEQSNRLLAERSAALQQLAESVEARERSSARRAEVLQIEQERLEELRSQQNLRQAELEKREASVQQRSLELGERFKKLESAREKLAQIVKGFNETVQFNTALHAISHTGLKRQEESAAELE